jgi:NAD(P)-dependent dehydrogenase (short-subunit alcohol dehydrogenase family)
MGNTVLVTGCSSGVGRTAARTFLDDGWTVYATARDPGELAELGEIGAVTTQLDVTSTEDAERVVESVVEERDRLDCLVNNAGFGQMGPVEDVSVDKVREQYDVNVFGPHRLMRAVLPYMRDQGSGTVINVTSITDRFPIAGSGAYSGSKSALAKVSQAARQEVRGQGIDVVVVEPMVVATEFYDRMRDELVDVDRRAAYTDLYEVLELLHTIKSDGPGIVSAEAVAETMLEAANSDSPDRRYTVGSLAKAAAVVAAVLPESWRTPVLYAGVRVSTSEPIRTLLQWWFARYHQAE